MRYQSFKFSNFKGIDSAEIKINGGVTTLIGLNESGKTTLLEAMFCFSYGDADIDSISPELKSLRDPVQWIPIAQRANFNGEVTITAKVALEAGDKSAFIQYLKQNWNFSSASAPETLDITERYLFKNSRFEKKRLAWGLKLAGLKGLERKQREYGAATPEWQGSVKFLATRLPRIWYFPNFLFDLPDRFELSATTDSQGNENSDRNRFYRSTFDQILSRVSAGANIEDHIVTRLRSKDWMDQRSLEALLLEMSRYVGNTVFGGWNRILGRSAPLGEVEIKAASEGDDSNFLTLRIKGPDGYYDLAERSLGFRWFFMFLLMTSFRDDSATPSRPIFLLDEPASNLHPKAQAELLKSFENLASQCHLVYTTHSHHLINIKWLDDAKVVKNTALGSLDFDSYIEANMSANTSISTVPYRRFVNENPDQLSYFQPVLDMLDYQPSRLEPIDEIVLVEGKSDFYYLRYMADVIKIKTELKFIPGGGAGSLEPLIRLYIGWGKNFVILLDGDAEGMKQRRRYIEEFGHFVSSRCLILPEICDDDKIEEIEDLFSDTDSISIATAIGSRPAAGKKLTKKEKLNSMMEVLARGEVVTVDSATKARVELLFDKLAKSIDGGKPVVDASSQ
ncbi:AAA family ATPase [Rhodococcus sp. APC 3903]|uniref:ATP-dependent nuclease n=1 Tax=Rhodococcus TaxID=1827 RepID=UPI0025B494E7|nr:AAA family ATPase [Rhodococcus sp. APC 3903]MDN3460806.1 AAA family ATPase [Rhodococcus sp. APC 3903]